MSSVTLYYRDARSDKVYQAAIERRENLFVVTFAYARRGATLQTGIKPHDPVDFSTAQKVFDKLAQEKKAKGYSPSENGTPYEHTENAGGYTGILPQLLNSIDEAEAQRLIKDSDWFLQEKFDGRRLLIEKRDGRVRGINRRGLVIDIPSPIAGALGKIAGDWLLDGESVGDTYHVFDLLFNDDCSFKDLPYRLRLNGIERILEKLNSKSIKLVPSIHGEERKQGEFKRLRLIHAEGVVLKLSTATHSSGRPATGGPALKYKFTATDSFIVAKHNEARSVGLKVFDQTRLCGNVTIPPNQDVPPIGSVVEVRYLYAYRGGSLYQPVFVGVRNDIDVDECLLGKLKFKREEAEDDGE